MKKRINNEMDIGNLTEQPLKTRFSVLKAIRHLEARRTLNSKPLQGWGGSAFFAFRVVIADVACFMKHLQGVCSGFL